MALCMICDMNYFLQDLTQKKYQADSCIRDLKSKLTVLEEVKFSFYYCEGEMKMLDTHERVIFTEKALTHHPNFHQPVRC